MAQPFITPKTVSGDTTTTIWEEGPHAGEQVILSQPEHGTLVATTHNGFAAIDYVPEVNFSGSDSFVTAYSYNNAYSLITYAVTVKPDTNPPPAGEHTPATLDIGDGNLAVTLHVAQDFFQGDAQYVVAVDGQQVGGVQLASALFGQSADTVRVHGNFGSGDHDITVQFLNDAWGGTDADRNLYVTAAEDSLGHSISVSNGNLWSTGDSAHVTSMVHVATTVDLGTGAVAATVQLAQNFYGADAQYVVLMDGQQVGGVQSASALFNEGADTVRVHGDFGIGQHDLAIQFLNDAWGGTAATDRNLHVIAAQDMTSNGLAVTNGALMSTGDTAHIVLPISTGDYIFGL